jgi:prepilin signal peptidase PulO-like enzyme (type II secretory pathway)
MALTLFGASFISLLVWLGISARKGLNKNRALPFAPFLISSAGLVFVIDFYLGVGIIQFFFS